MAASLDDTRVEKPKPLRVLIFPNWSWDHTVRTPICSLLSSFSWELLSTSTTLFAPNPPHCPDSTEFRGCTGLSLSKLRSALELRHPLCLILDLSQRGCGSPGNGSGQLGAVRLPWTWSGSRGGWILCETAERAGAQRGAGEEQSERLPGLLLTLRSQLQTNFSWAKWKGV